MKEDIENIWKESEWTLQAWQLIDGIKRFSENSPIFLILRHSHRIDSNDMKVMANLGLTTKGRKIARIFGCNLPINRFIRLYYSIVPRCQETAEEILKGFESNGGKGTLIGPFEPLYNIGNNSAFVMKQAFKYPGPQFINRWAAGLFPPDSITPFIKYCKNSAKDIWSRDKNISSNDINIYVTHDLILMALRLGWFGISPNTDWVSYLGGFAFILQRNKIKLLDKDKILELEMPYWWQKGIF